MLLPRSHALVGGTGSSKGRTLVPRTPNHSVTVRSLARSSSVVPRAAAGGGGGLTGGGSGKGGGGGGGGGGAGGGDAHPMRNWTFAYAAFLAAGGAFAYAKKGSVKSLTSAGGAALILALAARQMAGAAAKGSVAVALAISVLLTIVMARRYQASRKMMPAGMTAGVSLLISAAYIGSLT